MITDRLVQGCLDAGTTCWPEPAAFTTYAIYASMALVEVIISLNLSLEERMRGRDYAPEWR